jgi:NAD(P)-dependent dehydrogenase (short-subunit alcohol dehydrogenase family)
MMTSLPKGYRALVLGASGALGAAFVSQLQADACCAQVIGLSRRSTPALVLEDEASVRDCGAWLASHIPLHLVIDATGALSLDGRCPEKRLDELDPQHLARAMAVNAIGPAVLLKHLVPLLATGERVVWAKLSARVGSITDNHKGGWFGYRASKAALNMVLQTAAIEIARRRPLAVVAALQPGTVRSALSRPFVGNEALDPAESAARLLRVIDGLPATGRAHFVDHQGAAIPW